MTGCVSIQIATSRYEKELKELDARFDASVALIVQAYDTYDIRVAHAVACRCTVRSASFYSV